MAATVHTLGGTVEVETAKIEVNAIGDGVVVTVTLVDPDGTAIIAGSRIISKWGYSMEAATTAGTEIMGELNALLTAAVE